MEEEQLEMVVQVEVDKEVHHKQLAQEIHPQLVLHKELMVVVVVHQMVAMVEVAVVVQLLLEQQMVLVVEEMEVQVQLL